MLQRGVIPYVALGVGVSVAPLLGGLAEKGDVQQIRLLGVNEGGLCLGDRGRDEGIADGVGVDAIVDLGQGALKVPIELQAVVFVVFEPLEFFDEVELELRAEPRAELEGDVFVGKGAAIAASAGDQATRAGAVDPLFGGEVEAVLAGLIFNSLEFDGIENGVIDAFSDAEKEDGILVF